MGKWITVHGHHVYLKDPSEMDDSLKGKQFKETVRLNTEYRHGYFGPSKEEKEAAKTVEEDLAQYKKAFPDNTVEGAYDAMYDYYPQLMPGDDATHLITNDEEGENLVFATINFNSSKDSDVWDKAKIRISSSTYDEFTDKELWDHFGIERERPASSSTQSTTSAAVMSPKVKALINKKSKHFTTKFSESDGTTLYQNTQNESWARVYKVQYGSGYAVQCGNILGDYARDLHGTNGTGVRLYNTAEQAHKRAQEYLVTINRRGY